MFQMQSYSTFKFPKSFTFRCLLYLSHSSFCSLLFLFFFFISIVFFLTITQCIRNIIYTKGDMSYNLYNCKYIQYNYYKIKNIYSSLIPIYLLITEVYSVGRFFFGWWWSGRRFLQTLPHAQCCQDGRVVR